MKSSLPCVSNKVTVINSGFETSFTDLTQFQSEGNGSFFGKDDPFQIGESNVEKRSADNDPLSFKNFYLGNDLCNDGGFGELIPSKVVCSGSNLESLGSIEDNVMSESEVQAGKNNSCKNAHSLHTCFNSTTKLNNTNESHYSHPTSRGSDFNFESFNVGSPLWKNCTELYKHDGVTELPRHDVEPNVADGILADLNAIYSQREQGQKQPRRSNSIIDRNDRGEERHQKRKKNGVMKVLFRKQGKTYEF